MLQDKIEMEPCFDRNKKMKKQIKIYRLVLILEKRWFSQKKKN